MDLNQQGGSVAVTPIPVPPGAARVLLLGGVFDPVHRGHVEAGAAARDLALGPDAWLVFVPAARSPFKPHGPEAADTDRAAMLRLALGGVARSGVWTDELERPAPSFWIDTVRRARGLLNAGADLRFAIGADAAVPFHRWLEWRAILELAEPVVMARPPVRTTADFGAALAAGGGWTPPEIVRWQSKFVEGAVLDISATDVRRALGAGDPRAAGWLHPAVYAFIRRNGLYHGMQGPTPLAADRPQAGGGGDANGPRM